MTWVQRSATVRVRYIFIRIAIALLSFWPFDISVYYIIFTVFSFCFQCFVLLLVRWVPGQQCALSVTSVPSAIHASNCRAASTISRVCYTRPTCWNQLRCACYAIHLSDHLVLPWIIRIERLDFKNTFTSFRVFPSLVLFGQLDRD